ncbi:hypothetical protein H8N00_33725 [Streptomyces sp. AC563]|uniref:hypothetical protein n=1 Tax=Streptomyces buecherae TaxID=2763006 RepID=UPI00164D4A17|nr:hypothetical protein [Streptomyces buecherae]MBC3993746.1 hypothetical protein [Streptomyces buecherae]
MLVFNLRTTGQLSSLEGEMALAQPCPRADQESVRPPGPNQWLKDHLDSVIDDQLLADARGGHLARPEPATPR